MSATRMFRVARGSGDGPARYQAYDVREEPRMTVLDGLLHIQRHLDRTLTFRFNCRAGMCGACGVRVNGVERLACSTRLSAVPGTTVTVDPLRHLPVVWDVMVDFEPFFEAWNSVRPSFVPRPAPSGSTGGAKTADRAAATPEPVATARITPDAPERRAIDPHRECISCGICYSACDVVSLSPAFPGPAAINRAYCMIMDSRDGGREDRLAILDSERGCWRCHTHGTCAELCPKGLDPTQAIEAVKRLLARRSLARLVGGRT
jgi:fumarate reductase iron-sulfur subunit